MLISVITLSILHSTYNDPDNLFAFISILYSNFIMIFILGNFCMFVIL